MLFEIAFYIVAAIVVCGGLFVWACYEDRIID